VYLWDVNGAIPYNPFMVYPPGYYPFPLVHPFYTLQQVLV
jgi:hypothetical protein